MKFESVMHIVKYWLDKDPTLWLHKHSDLLILRVQSTLDESDLWRTNVPAETVTRCRRKIYELGELEITDPEIKAEYQRVRAGSEKKYKEFFGNKKEITIRSDML